MKWRVVMEVTSADGTVRVHEIGGGAAVDEYSPWTVGLAEGKLVHAVLHYISFRHRRRIIAAAGGDAGARRPTGQAVPPSFVFVRYRECFRAPVRAMPLRSGPPPDPQSDQ